MNERWMKSGATGLPHWIKLFGSERLTTACGTTIARSDALNVETEPASLASAPERFISLPKVAHCASCGQKAQLQA
jgi:hypothetical protein